MVQTIITFIYLLALFNVQNFKKFLTADPELWQCTIFVPKMVHLPQTIFFWENYYYHSHLPISPFHWAKFKNNSSRRSRVMRMCNFWAQNGPFPQMRFFCFFYSCLSTCQKSKSDINLLVKYWWLKNTEISLAESHFCL